MLMLKLKLINTKFNDKVACLINPNILVSKMDNDYLLIINGLELYKFELLTADYYIMMDILKDCGNLIITFDCSIKKTIVNIKRWEMIDCG